jgi:8-oxo-dGTP diphosphatase
MNNLQNEIESTVIRAAGGLIWRDSATGRQLEVIRRARYGEEWTLPKGKLQPEESWSHAALREVKEETGCEVALGALVGCNAYVKDGKPKLVLFWNMDLAHEGQREDLGEGVSDHFCWLPFKISQP